MYLLTASLLCQAACCGAAGGLSGRAVLTGSLYLAQNILRLHHFPSQAAVSFDAAALASSKVLELGAGTGVLAALLGPLCQSYTASDRLENLKLVQRNIALNAAQPTVKTGSRVPRLDKTSAATVHLEEIDWEAVSKRRKQESSRSPNADGYDLVIAVDCIYNENLVQPLVDTLAHYCPPGSKTVAWVVAELRSSDVVRHPTCYGRVR